MGTVLDAYPLIALIGGEAAADEVELILRQGDVAITAVNLAEATDVLERVYGVEQARLRAIVEPLLAAGLTVRPASEADAWRAGALRARHYRRRTGAPSLADCFLLAAAEPNDRIATTDGAVAQAARAEGLDVLGVPDSRGRRPYTR